MAGSPGERDIATLAEGSPWPCEMAGSPGERDIATSSEVSQWPCEMAGSPGERDDTDLVGLGGQPMAM